MQMQRPLSLLNSITNNFSNDRQIGIGGFAVVYKGLLQNGIVAVKKLTQTLDVHETKFHQEVDSLMRVKHKNIVRFLGHCSDTQGKVWKLGRKNAIAEERQGLLCFEFLAEGSLDKHISNASQGLEWITRYQIIKGICEGLHYLHRQKIVHLDLKPANILLDHYMVPKIADFGLSKCFDEKQTRSMTSNVFGSQGYMAPEFYGGLITFKSDIYSLGIIILEILTGQKGYPEIEDVLQSWTARFGTSQGGIRLEPVRICTEIGIDCIESNPAKRPDTYRIMERLEEMECTYGFIKTDLLTSSVTNDPNRNTLHQYAQDSSDRNAEQMYRGSHFQQDIVATPTNYFEENAGTGDSQLYRHDNQDYSVDGDPLPGIEGLQIVGKPRPGSALRACGFSTNGTTLCNFQWVRYLEDGTSQHIEDATMYDHVVTADDVGTLLAVHCTPMDDSGRQGDLVREFANNEKKIACDPEMQNDIDLYISNGRADFVLYTLLFPEVWYFPEEWELATLVLRKPGYQIKLKDTGDVVIDEKYSPNLQSKIPNGRTTQFVLVSSGDVNVPFNTQGITDNEDYDVRLRDIIILVIRTFQSKALDAKT